MPKSKNPLKTFSKLQLLELLAQQERELQILRKELEEKTAELEDRRIAMQECGSIAEAALKLNGIFEAAQQAADQYLESLKAAHTLEAAKPDPLDEEIIV